MSPCSSQPKTALPASAGREGHVDRRGARLAVVQEPAAAPHDARTVARRIVRGDRAIAAAVPGCARVDDHARRRVEGHADDPLLAPGHGIDGQVQVHRRARVVLEGVGGEGAAGNARRRQDRVTGAGSGRLVAAHHRRIQLRQRDLQQRARVTGVRHQQVARDHAARRHAGRHRRRRHHGRRLQQPAQRHEQDGAPGGHRRRAAHRVVPVRVEQAVLPVRALDADGRVGIQVVGVVHGLVLEEDHALAADGLVVGRVQQDQLEVLRVLCVALVALHHVAPLHDVAVLHRVVPVVDQVVALLRQVVPEGRQHGARRAAGAGNARVVVADQAALAERDPAVRADRQFGL